MSNQDIMIKEMYKAGVHFGRKKSVTHPKMLPFVHGVKNDFQVINLEKTAEQMTEASEFLRKLVRSGGKIIFVGTKPPARKVIEAAAKGCGQLYVVTRWLGGTITNFWTISKRIEYMKDLEKKKESGELKKYTKKEQLNFEKLLADLVEKFDGLRGLDKLPQAVFVSDAKEEAIVVNEAKRKKIPVIGLVNTDADPSIIDYPIAANNNSVSSIRWIVEKLSEAIKSEQKSGV